MCVDWNGNGVITYADAADYALDEHAIGFTDLPDACLLLLTHQL
jgi:hypothetical protein